MTKKKTQSVKKVKFKVGDIVVIGYGAFPHNAYAGFTARVEYCKTCCKAFRLQMLECGNNARYDAADETKLYPIKP